jgi:hypothetical protein
VLPCRRYTFAITVPSGFLARLIAPVPVIFSSLPSIASLGMMLPFGPSKVTSM